MTKRKVMSVLLAFVTLVSALFCGAAADAGDVIDGEIARTYASLGGGAELASYVLGSSSGYGVQEFSAVTFDPAGLLVDTVFADGDGEGLVSLAARYAREEGRRVIAAASAGKGGYFASHKRPVRFGETGETLGVTADGRALVGRISASVELRDRANGETLVLTSLNAASDYALFTGDCAEYRDLRSPVMLVECDGGLEPGVPLEGRVAAFASPKEAAKIGEGLFAVAAPKEALASFDEGDPVTLTASVEDEYGNTALWRTVESAVGGLVPLVRSGENVAAQGARTGATVVGVKPDGEAVILTSYVGQNGYSLGFTPTELAELCSHLGLVHAFAAGLSDGAHLIAAANGKPFALTGRRNGSGDAESAIVICVPSDGAETVPEICEYEEHSAKIRDAKSAGYSPDALAEALSPYRREAASVTLRADDPAQAAAACAERSGALDVLGDDYLPTMTLWRQIEFDSTGEWLTLVIKESDLEAWYGKIY